MQPRRRVNPSVLTLPPAAPCWNSRVESEEEQTDSEDDEYMDDIDFQPTAVAKKIVRRESVSAEQVGANTVRAITVVLCYCRFEFS